MNEWLRGLQCESSSSQSTWGIFYTVLTRGEGRSCLGDYGANSAEAINQHKAFFAVFWLKEEAGPLCSWAAGWGSNGKAELKPGTPEPLSVSQLLQLVGAMPESPMPPMLAQVLQCFGCQSLRHTLWQRRMGIPSSPSLCLHGGEVHMGWGGVVG